MGKPIVESLRELSELFSKEGEWTHGSAIDETCRRFGIKQNPWWAVDYSQILAFIADEIERERQCTVDWNDDTWGVCECGGDVYEHDIHCSQCGREVMNRRNDGRA